MKLTIAIVEGTTGDVLTVIRQVFNGHVSQVIPPVTVNRPIHTRLPKTKTGKISLADAVRQSVAEGPAPTDEIMKRVLKILPKLDKSSMYAAVHNLSKRGEIERNGENWVPVVK